MSGSGLSLRKRLFNLGIQACPWTQHKHQLTSFDTLQIMFQHFLVNYPFNAELWRDFCSPVNLRTSFFYSDRTFFPSSLTALFPADLSPSVSHSSTFHWKASLQVSGFYSWFILATPISRTPLPLCTPCLLRSLSPTSCRPLPVVAVCGGSGEQRGVCWFSLIHIMSPTFLLLCPGSPSLLLRPPSPSPNSPSLLCQFSPPTFPASSPKPTTSSSSNLSSSLSLITSSCPPCGWRTKS